MTDRLKGCVVAFDSDIRDDDAKGIIDAIMMVKGVMSVSTSISSPEDYMNRSRIHAELGQKLFDVIYPPVAER